MKLTVERLPESQVRLDITAEETEFRAALERAYRTVGKGITLPGFRKGKAPRVMIERYYGREVFVEEAHKEVVDTLYREAMTRESLIPVGPPEVELTAVEPVGFTVTVPVYPTVDISGYADVRVESRDAAIDEAEVDTLLERLRLTRGPWADPAEARSPRDGDQIMLDIAVTNEAEPFQEPVQGATFILGESNLFDGLVEQVKEMTVGEERTFDIVFADDDESVDELIRGKTLSYTVTLQSLKEREPRELDDEFAKEVGEVDTVEELVRTVREDLHRAKTREVRTLVLNEITDAMTDAAAVELPAVMIDEAVDEDVTRLRTTLAQEQVPLETYLRSNGQTEAEMREEMRPEAARRLSRSLVMRAVAEREGIAVTAEDLEAEVGRMTEGAADPDRLRDIYRGDYFQRMMRNQLFEQRLTDRLIEIATEGRGATLNGHVPGDDDDVVTDAGGSTTDEDAEATAVGGEATADDVVTTGTMPGQPGDVAATATATDPDAAVGVTEAVSYTHLTLPTKRIV